MASGARGRDGCAAFERLGGYERSVGGTEQCQTLCARTLMCRSFVSWPSCVGSVPLMLLLCSSLRDSAGGALLRPASWRGRGKVAVAHKELVSLLLSSPKLVGMVPDNPWLCRLLRDGRRPVKC